MSRYETDEEQWEAIKQWWKENGKLIVLAAIVGVGAVTGW
ncbi:MAG TPA: tetratricopeptide repeat protein, partial [Piscirickettsiaceae bacterium]|nr:tetratricopeptide repeat protein [Piscirickettsiaceae bacterium]